MALYSLPLATGGMLHEGGSTSLVMATEGFLTNVTVGPVEQLTQGGLSGYGMQLYDEFPAAPTEADQLIQLGLAGYGVQTWLIEDNIPATEVEQLTQMGLAGYGVQTWLIEDNIPAPEEEEVVNYYGRGGRRLLEYEDISKAWETAEAFEEWFHRIKQTQADPDERLVVDRKPSAPKPLQKPVQAKAKRVDVGELLNKTVSEARISREFVRREVEEAQERAAAREAEEIMDVLLMAVMMTEED